MISPSLRNFAAVAAALILATAAQAQDAPTFEERLQKIEQDNESLRSNNAFLKQENDELSRKFDLLAEEFENFNLGPAELESGARYYGLGPAASRVYAIETGVSLAGYGEAVYQNFASTNDAGFPSGKKDQADLLRAVLYFGYKFSDEFVFNSEIEFEHASTGAGGSASVEFAYLDWLADPAVNVRAGLVLIPMGFVNELHEPVTFYSANRPSLERYIIPTTWPENGIGVFGDVGPVSYRSYIVNGFDAGRFSSSGVRGARQKGSEAIAEDFAWVTRVDVTPTPGLTFGGSGYFGYAGQDLMTPAGFGIDGGIYIVEAHAEFEWEGLRLRLLGAAGRIDDAAAINVANGLAGTASIGQTFGGYYGELGYDLFTIPALDPGDDMSLVPFVRLETLDTQSSVPSFFGFASDPSTSMDIFTVGMSFQPIPEIIVKADWQNIRNGAGTGVDQFNLAAGWIF